jgi:hypothetical protein
MSFILDTYHYSTFILSNNHISLATNPSVELSAKR